MLDHDKLCICISNKYVTYTYIYRYNIVQYIYTHCIYELYWIHLDFIM